MKRKHKVLLGVVTVLTVFAIWLVVDELKRPKRDFSLHDETYGYGPLKQKEE